MSSEFDRPLVRDKGKSTISFGYDSPPVNKSQTGNRKPVSLADYASKRTSNPTTSVPLSTFKFAQNNPTNLQSQSSLHQYHVKGRIGRADRNRESVEKAPLHKPLARPSQGHSSDSAIGDLLGGNLPVNVKPSTMVDHEHHKRLTPSATESHLKSIGGVLTHTGAETERPKMVHVDAGECRIGDMLGGHSTLPPEEPKHHHRSHPSATEDNLRMVDGVLTHVGQEVQPVKMHNIHSGDCSIGDMLGGHNTVPVEQPRHHHKVQFNSSESHIGNMLGESTVQPLPDPIPHHHRVIESAATEDHLGVILDQTKDKTTITPKFNATVSSAAMLDIMTGKDTVDHSDSFKTGKQRSVLSNQSELGGLLVSPKPPKNRSVGSGPMANLPKKGVDRAKNNTSSIIFG